MRLANAPSRCIVELATHPRHPRPRSDVISATSRIVALGLSGRISAARDVFDEMPERDAVAWNAMLTSYARSGRPRDALSLFSRMISLCAAPDPFSFTAALSASAALRDLAAGKALHALLLRLGLRSLLPVANALLGMYAKCAISLDAALAFDEMEERNALSWCSLLHAHVNSRNFGSARRLFDEMPARGVVAWNILITGYAQIGEAEFCLDLFKAMQMSGFRGDDATVSILVNACSELTNSFAGRMIHSYAIQRGWNGFVEVNNSLLSFYAKFGSRDDAVRLFELMESRTLVSWNTMINAHMKFGAAREALSLFRRAPETNVVSWTAVMAGFARNGDGEEALSLFHDMIRSSRARPDDFTFGAVLHACALMAALGSGMMVHSCVVRSGFESSIYVANGLVDMYAKCGDVDGSRKVFDRSVNKDLVSWNAMLFGLAQHGRSSKALELYEDMLAHNIQPDEVTFVGILTACCHSGYLEEGGAFLAKMELVHRLKPNSDHLTCIVDMLGRAGHLEEAAKLVEGYPKIARKGATDICEALLSSCFVRGDASIGKRVGEELVSMEPQKEVGYVMLSNLYCANGQWKAAEKVRREMIEQGVKKSPGCSWIEVRDMVRVFVSGTQSLNDLPDVYDIIGLLDYELRNPSFIFFQQ
ncbi:pentatricopeptide repeat-containing protein At2g36980, mitochondrial-like [Ananas comosus]|uniref:Pentatricopeptide repeat-containing protein At2g36980, mitochondrial-like n=1 Tax=Ananas comosus TaxID=4615 RepID=A0A6P5H150_ANACO|nr:pentatricopeptide repeat-containing protein At2g36980, mitochondrial-like [Ananas comosus]